MAAIHATGFTEQLFRVLPKNVYLRTSTPYTDDKTETQYDVHDRKTHGKIVTFRARQMPGCCGVLVVYYLRPVGSMRKTGRFFARMPEDVFLEYAELIIKAAGLAKNGQVIFTQIVESAGAKTLQKLCLGDKYCRSEFTNWKTNSKVYTFLFLTEQPKKPEAKPVFSGE